MTKILVVYYSFEGNTKFIAEAIASELGADIQPLIPVKDLKSKSVSKYVWGGRQAVMKSKPELEPLDVKLEDYDVIFIGTPVWAFTFAPTIRSFFADHYLEGKKIALFCTHDGGPASTLENMEKSLLSNEIIGKLGLVSVLRKEPERKKASAVEWAKSVV